MVRYSDLRIAARQFFTIVDRHVGRRRLRLNDRKRLTVGSDIAADTEIDPMTAKLREAAK